MSSFSYYAKYPKITSTIRTQTKDTKENDAKNNLFDVTKYGAKGDGTTDDTDAITSAIKAAMSNHDKQKFGYQSNTYSRNTILFPDKSRFLFNSLFIKKGKNLAFQIGAKTTLQMMNYNSTNPPQGINFEDCTNIVFEGIDPGVSYVHGAGTSWSHVCKGKTINKSGNITYRSFRYSYPKNPYNILSKKYLDFSESNPDSQLLIFTRTNIVLVRNCSFFHSPQAHVVFNYGQQLECYNIRIISPYDSANTDGFHFNNCNGGTFYNSFVCDGDDCVVMGGSTQMGNFEIHHLKLTSGHGISFGSKIDNTIDNVYIHDIDGSNLVNGIRFKSSSSDNGTVSNVTVENYTMKGVKNAIVIENGSYNLYNTFGIKNYDNHYNSFYNTNAQNGASLKNIYLHNLSGDTINHVGQLSCGTDSQCDNVIIDTLNFTNILGTVWECTGKPNITVKNSNPKYDCTPSYNKYYVPENNFNFNNSNTLSDCSGPTPGCEKCCDCA